MIKIKTPKLNNIAKAMPKKMKIHFLNYKIQILETIN